MISIVKLNRFDQLADQIDTKIELKPKVGTENMEINHIDSEYCVSNLSGPHRHSNEINFRF